MPPGTLFIFIFCRYITYPDESLKIKTKQNKIKSSPLPELGVRQERSILMKKNTFSDRETNVLAIVATIIIAAIALLSVVLGIRLAEILAPLCTDIRDGAVPLLALLMTVVGGTYSAYTYVPKIVRKVYLWIRHFFTTLLK